MSKQKTDTPVVTDAAAYMINLGPLQLPFSAIEALQPIDATVRAIELSDTREKVARVVDGKIVNYTISLYIQRDPLSEAEATRVAVAKADRDAKAKLRKDEEQSKREREIDAVRMHTLAGVEAGLRTMANIGPQLQQAANIAHSLGLGSEKK